MIGTYRYPRPRARAAAGARHEPPEAARCSGLGTEIEMPEARPLPATPEQHKWRPEHPTRNTRNASPGIAITIPTRHHVHAATATFTSAFPSGTNIDAG